MEGRQYMMILNERTLCVFIKKFIKFDEKLLILY
jgi:hypothetical protein